MTPETNEPVNPGKLNLEGAREAFNCSREFTAFFMLLLIIAIPAAAFGMSYIFKWPAAYLLHDIFIVTGTLTAVFAVLVLFFAVYKLKAADFRAYIRSHIFAVFFAPLLIIAGVSTLLSGDLKMAFYGVPFRYNGFLAYIIYASAAISCLCISSENQRSRLLNLFICVSVILSLVMLCQNYGVKFVTNLNGTRNQSVFLNPNHFGYLLSMSILCIGGKLTSQKRLIPAVVYGVLFVFEVWVLTLNDTFGCVVAVFGAALIMTPVYRLTVTKKMWLAILPLVLFMAVYILTDAINTGRGGSDVGSLLSDTKTIIDSAASGGTGTPKLKNSDRFDLWAAAFRYTREKPVFGWGPDSVGPKFTADGFNNTAAHNEYFQMMAELGIPALILYLGGIISAVVIWLRKLYFSKRINKDAVSASKVTAAGAALVYMISACFGVSMFYTAPFFYIMLMLSL